MVISLHAQGLLKIFACNTNVISLLSRIDDAEVTPIYVTRTFTTRHGNGPLYYPQFFDESDNVIENEIELHDDTNVHNEWQGYMRYGKLSIDQLKSAIQKDYYLAYISSDGMVTKPLLAVTWGNLFPEVVDRLEDEFVIYTVANERTRDDVEEIR